jgi:hypothetical protein
MNKQTGRLKTRFPEPDLKALSVDCLYWASVIVQKYSECGFGKLVVLISSVSVLDQKVQKPPVRRIFENVWIFFHTRRATKNLSLTVKKTFLQIVRLLN